MINTTAGTLLAEQVLALLVANKTDFTTENYSATGGPILDEDGNIICAGPSEEEFIFYMTFAWWLEGFGIILVGSLGK